VILAWNTNTPCCWTFVSKLDLAHWLEYYCRSNTLNNSCWCSLVCKYLTYINQQNYLVIFSIALISRFSHVFDKANLYNIESEKELGVVRKET